MVFCDTTNEAQTWLADIKTCIDEQAKKALSGHYKTDSHSAGVWVPDSHAKNCTVCNDKFSFVNRRHHCRRCGALVCGKCSKYKLPNGEYVMQRSCKKFYFQLNIAETNGDNDSKMDSTDMDDDADDFEDENAALHYVDNTKTFTTGLVCVQQKLIFSCAIPRNEVEQKLNNNYGYCNGYTRTIQ